MDGFFENFFGVRLLVFVARQENHGQGQVFIFRNDFAFGLKVSTQEGVRDLREQAGAVARHRIGINGTTVGEITKTFHGPIDNGMGLLTAKVGDKADAAGIALHVFLPERRRVTESNGLRHGRGVHVSAGKSRPGDKI